MKKLYILIIGMAFMASSAFAQVDYTPTNTGTRSYEKWGDKREIAKVVLTHADGSVDEFALDATQRTQEYVDATALKTFLVLPEEEVTISIVFAHNSSWVHHYVYIDKDSDGFTAEINRNGYTPEGDLVAYSFYNNGSDSDNPGCNSNGDALVDNDRSLPAIPSFTVTDMEGVYRMRIKQDWCNIDPMGDSDGKFPNAAVPNLTDFQANGGQIIDVMLQVTNPEPEVSSIESVSLENVNVACYDLTGRPVKEITAPGIYIINGKKTVVK